MINIDRSHLRNCLIDTRSGGTYCTVQSNQEGSWWIVACKTAVQSPAVVEQETFNDFLSLHHDKKSQCHNLISGLWRHRAARLAVWSKWWDSPSWGGRTPWQPSHLANAGPKCVWDCGISNQACYKYQFTFQQLSNPSLGYFVWGFFKDCSLSCHVVMSYRQTNDSIQRLSPSRCCHHQNKPTMISSMPSWAEVTLCQAHHSGHRLTAIVASVRTLPQTTWTVHSAQRALQVTLSTSVRGQTQRQLWKPTSPPISVSPQEKRTEMRS